MCKFIAWTSVTAVWFNRYHRVLCFHRNKHLFHRHDHILLLSCHRYHRHFCSCFIDCTGGCYFIDSTIGSCVGDMDRNHLCSLLLLSVVFCMGDVFGEKLSVTHPCYCAVFVAVVVFAVVMIIFVVVVAVAAAIAVAAFL